MITDHRNCGHCGIKRHYTEFNNIEANTKCDTCKAERIANDVARVAKQKAIETPDYSKLNSLWLTT